ncbi:MAG TPA: DUF4869 domain-containing protein [Lachnospiraceae bacterium]|nr:DUF4869 domain-containing protein [Lachnospiraceae bacterium]
MLKIYFGDMDNAIFNTEIYFKNDYDPEWLNDPAVRQMILDVDSSVVLSSGAIDSPVMGVIPPTSLSGGVKTLILILKEPEKVFNASNCGDNCAGWLLRMGKERDVTINLRHIMDFGDEAFEIYVMNDNVVVTNMMDLLKTAGRYV